MDQFGALDRGFVAASDLALADAARRGGAHLACRPGCAQCCIGVFAIGPADALRLRRGMEELQGRDPERAARLRTRAREAWVRLQPGFPGDLLSGRLETAEDGSPSAAFETFADEEPCPALDPATSTCDLYSARPETCRSFGPPVALGPGFGICELCFQHATAEEIAAAALDPPAPEVLAALDRAAIAEGEPAGPTLVAFVLATHTG
jgi:Fe-S-cluster containining protein